MNNFSEFFSAPRIQRQVTAVVNQTDWELGYFNPLATRSDGTIEQPTNIVDILFPTAVYQSTQLLVNKFKASMVVASLTGPDDAMPTIHNRFQLQEERLSKLTIGAQHVFKESDYQLLRDLDLYRSNNSPGAVETAAAIEAALIGTAAQFPAALDAKHVILLFKLATEGALDYTDPLTGVKAQLSMNDTVSALLPVAPGTLWNQAAATGLAQLELLSEEYRKVHGYKPPILVAHYDDLRNLAAQTATRAQLAAMMGTDAANNANLYIPVNYDRNSYQLEDGMLLDAIRARCGAVDVYVFDSKYSENDKAGALPDKMFLPKGYIMFGEPGMGERARLPFKENRWTPGIFTLTEEINKAPLSERVVGMTAGVPFIADGRKICAQRINAA